MVDKAFLIGVVRNDPVYRQVSAGSGYHTFEIGVERSWRTFDTKQKKSEIDWIPCIAWNKRFIDQACRKGDTVVLYGRIQRRDVTDRATGFTYPLIEVLAEYIENAKLWKPPVIDRNGRVQDGETDAYGDPLEAPLRQPDEE